MSKKSLGSKTASGVFWRLLERLCAQGVSFILSIILARILMPSDYGVVALLLIFMNISYVFVVSGFGEALIQAKDVGKKDFSTVFYCNLAVGFILYTILFFTAPQIAKFYGNPDLINMLRVLALSLPIMSFSNIQHAYVQRKMLFRKFFWSTLSGTLISGVVGITIAYLGYGPWALIAQNLTNTIIDSIVLLIVVDCKPGLEFSWSLAKKHMKFGWKLTAGALVNSIYEELRSLIIGKKYSSSDLAFYNKGAQFPKLIVNNLNTAVSSVLLPVFSKKNHADNSAVKPMLAQSIQMSAYLLFPLMTGMALVAKPMISLLLTDQWLPCVPYMQILCFYNAYVLISAIDNQSIKAIGRSDLYLKMTIIRRVSYVVLLLLVINKGVMAIAFTNIITVFIAFFVNGFYLSKYLKYSYLERIRDLLPAILLSACMGVGVYFVGMLFNLMLLKLFIQIIVGVLIYLILSKVFKVKSYLKIEQMLIGMLRKVLNKK